MASSYSPSSAPEGEASVAVTVSGMSMSWLSWLTCGDPLLGDDAREHGERDEGEADRDDQRDDEAEDLGALPLGCGAGPAEGLRGAPDAVVEVRAEGEHRDDVDQRHPPQVEGVDHQEVGVVGGAARRVDLADGEVEQVPDQEDQ